MVPWSELLRWLGELVFQSPLDDYCAVGNMARGSFVKSLTGLLTLQGALGNPVKSKDAYPAAKPSSSIVGDGQLGAVASESDICSHIGIDLLKAGGNAADAMVGTVACVGVVGMYHSGKFISSCSSSHLHILTNQRNRWRWLHARPSTKRYI